MIFEQLFFGLNLVTLVFLLIMLLIFISGILLPWFNKKNAFSDYISYIPTALTSLGILGTFTGIVIGLWSFNLEEIDVSIASLLEGLKTAFITSIFGIFLSILFRLLGYILPKTESEKRLQNTHKTIDDLYEVMEHSLVFQQNNQALLLEQQDKQQRFFTQFSQDHAEKFSSEMATQLNGLVSSFNDNLQQQFGDHLKYFSESFSKIDTVFENIDKKIDLQHQHIQLQKQQWDESSKGVESFSHVIERINQSLDQLSISQSSLVPIYENQVEQIDLIQKSNESLSQTLNQLDSQIPNLGENLSALESCISLLSNDLSQNLLQYQQEFKTDSDKQRELFLAGIESWTQSVENTQQQFSQASQALESFIEQTQYIKTTSFEKIADLNVQMYQDNLEKMSDMQKNMHQKINDNLGQTLALHLESAQSFSNKQHDNIEQLMQRELDVVFKQMGDALGEISGQFTRDYQLIISQMQQVLNQNQALLK